MISKTIPILQQFASVELEGNCLPVFHSFWKGILLMKSYLYQCLLQLTVYLLKNEPRVFKSSKDFLTGFNQTDSRMFEKGIE